jgi:hypothetical protein
LEKNVLPNFAKLFVDFLKRVDQITGILGKSEAPIGTPVPVEPEKKNTSFTPPNRNNTEFLNTNFVQQPDETEVSEPLQQVAYNEENIGEGAVDVNKLVDEKIVPLLAALVYNTGATERAIKNAPARFSNA